VLRHDAGASVERAGMNIRERDVEVTVGRDEKVLREGEVEVTIEEPNESLDVLRHRLVTLVEADRPFAAGVRACVRACVCVRMHARVLCV
jgi:hypothetical protein